MLQMFQMYQYLYYYLSMKKKNCDDETLNVDV